MRSTENIGYLKLVAKTPDRIWKLYDADGHEIRTGHCVDCTTTAINRDIRVLTIH